MGVVLTILKFIGIALLVILCVVLLIIILVLAVPIRYQADGGGASAEGRVDVHARVTWLLHLLSVEVSVHKERGSPFALDKDIRVLGISLLKKKKKAEALPETAGGAANAEALPGPSENPEAVSGQTDSASANEDLQSIEAQLSGVDGTETSAYVPDGLEADPGAYVSEDSGISEATETGASGEASDDTISGAPGESSDDTEAGAPGEASDDTVSGAADEASIDTESGAADEASDDTEGTEVQKHRSRPLTFEEFLHPFLVRFFTILFKAGYKAVQLIVKIAKLLYSLLTHLWQLPIRITEKCFQAVDKVISLYSTADAWVSFLTDEHTTTLIKTLFGDVGKVLGHVMPKRFKADMAYGFEDPSIAGYLTGVTSLLIPRYGTDVSFEPDFQAEKTAVSGKAEAGGRIRLGYLAFLALTAVINRNTFYVIKRFKRLKEGRI